MSKQKGFIIMAIIPFIVVLLLFPMYLQVLEAKKEREKNEIAELIPIHQIYYDTALKQLNMRLTNKNGFKVQDLELECDITMKSGTNFKSFSGIFEPIAQNVTQTFTVSNFQYMANAGPIVIPKENIVKISSCRIVNFDKIE